MSIILIYKFVVNVIRISYTRNFIISLPKEKLYLQLTSCNDSLSAKSYEKVVITYVQKLYLKVVVISYAFFIIGINSCLQFCILNDFIIYA